MKQFINLEALESALRDLGRALQQLDEQLSLFVIGGSAMMLQEPERQIATGDIDVVALVGANGTFTQIGELPEPLRRAADAIRELHRLSPGWINASAGASFDHVVPDGAIDRATLRTWGGLTLHVAAREDLIRLKLRAALRRGSKGKRYRTDLAAFAPTDAEIQVAFDWLRNIDPTLDEDHVGSVVAEIMELRG
jgi:hypothetical protein